MNKKYLVKGTCDIFMGEIKIGSQAFECEMRSVSSGHAETTIALALGRAGGRNIKFEITTLMENVSE